VEEGELRCQPNSWGHRGRTAEDPASANAEANPEGRRWTQAAACGPGELVTNTARHASSTSANRSGAAPPSERTFTFDSEQGDARGRKIQERKWWQQLRNVDEGGETSQAM